MVLTVRMLMLRMTVLVQTHLTHLKHLTMMRSRSVKTCGRIWSK